MMTRNAQAILEVAAHIETYPERYNQREWGLETECGSAFCVAGTRAMLDGVGFELNQPDLSGTRTIFSWDTCSVGDHAQMRFGLGLVESKILFSACWVPREGMTVPEALRRLADGWPLVLVTSEYQVAALPFGFGPTLFVGDWADEAQNLLNEAAQFVKAHA